MRKAVAICVLVAACAASPKEETIQGGSVREADEKSYGMLWRKDLVEERDIQFAAASLQSNLSDRFPSADLRDCEDVVQLAVGKVGGNFVYGGNCVIQDGEGLTYASVCADEMVGYFAILESGLRPSSRDEMADWTYANCGQGG